MDFGSVNLIAALLAAVAFFALGGVWYGPVFGKLWMRESGISEAQAAESNMAALFGGTLVLELIAAFGLAALIGADSSAAAGAQLGLWVGLLIVVPALAVLALYERRSAILWALNSGYNLLGFVVMGAIIGAMQ
ncbi:MAG TPA: DUF1761 domain-containing protein [Egibacteraceae bacterium]|nr:DUF1761 domain-containing protein [Egibacteraceae bacterium]